MGSRKGSAKAKQIARFKAGLGGMDDLFAKEEALRDKRAQEKDAALPFFHRLRPPDKHHEI